MKTRQEREQLREYWQALAHEYRRLGTWSPAAAPAIVLGLLDQLDRIDAVLDALRLSIAGLATRPGTPEHDLKAKIIGLLIMAQLEFSGDRRPAGQLARLFPSEDEP